MQNHGNKGNKHAQKENPKKCRIVFRCTEKQKKEAEKKAKKENLSISSLILKRLEL